MEFTMLCVVLWQIVQVFDTYAGELGPALFARYEMPMLKAIAMEVKEKLAERKVEQVPMVLPPLQALAMPVCKVTGVSWLTVTVATVAVAVTKVTVTKAKDSLGVSMLTVTVTEDTYFLPLTTHCNLAARSRSLKQV